MAAAPMSGSEKLDLDDIQGIIYRGYGVLEHARFVLLGVETPAAARGWLDVVVDEITDSVVRPAAGGHCVNMAFTHAGLQKLGLPEPVLEQFAVEFREGMISRRRQRLLGDHGDSAPAKWRWGGSRGPAAAANLHALLALYAGSEDDLEALYSRFADTFPAGRLVELQPALHTIRLPGQKEHFGFRDGIAQPWIRGKPFDNDRHGAKRRVHPDNIVAAGEFLLGYENEYGELPVSPLIDAGDDPDAHLASGEAPRGKHDFGRNGSYLVFRQLSQQVTKFWRYVDDNAPDAAGQDRVWLAAKMVGRWPSGAPLSLYPNRDPAVTDPSIPEDKYKKADDFAYADDLAGVKCPIGSHIRRTNPRDTLSDDRQTAVKVAKRHRILRRGRAYGPPVAASMDPAAILASGSEEGERGLDFLCFNANIGRQFEFMQHTWVNNQKFGGLYRDADPVIGDHDPRWREDEGEVPETGRFTAPRCPVRLRVTELPRFVRVRGGAYFFMPGKRALRYLANLR